MEKATKILLDLFEIDGKKGSETLTAGQIDIFEQLVYRKMNRVQIESCTQYGKSLTVALACVIIACIQNELVSVVAPTKDKAKIIMRYFVQHLGDSVLFESLLEKNTKLDRLKQEESKNRIVLRNGGGIYAIGTDERNSAKSIEKAMGEGAKCLAGDTMIKTDRGNIPIKDIVEKNKNCKIKTFNHEKLKTEYKDIILYQQNGTEKLLEIDTGDIRLKCTESHPIYVIGKGYIKASNLKIGDELLIDK